ncbi:MAG: dialkylresorcinol condensing enzyme DarA [Flavobacteriaceae bacterium]|nr:dialkylresorcinol condensing enzyme DarA [Flavobacteriaceae bacterium]
MKNVLVVYYTQSGQLLDIAKNITNELASSEDVNLSFYEIKLKENFPFPWDKSTFYDAFPESFIQIPADLTDLNNPLLKQKYDLVVVAYQIWYLSPAVPINSFLKNKVAKQLLANTPVLTVIGCRNMWVMAQEKMKKLLVDNGANLVGHISLFDRHPNHISVITIFDWAFSGVKKRILGIFPKPGVSDKDIENSKRFSNDILQTVQSNKYTDLQDKLLNKGAVVIKPFLIVTDKRAQIIFDKWSSFVYKKGKAKDPKRQFRLQMFSYYLMFAIWIIAPLVFIVYLFTFPFTMAKRKKEKYYYSHTKLK